MSQRVQLRGSTRYVTAQKLSRKTRTPGAKVVLINTPKIKNAVKCGDCKSGLQGVKRPSKSGSSKLKYRERKVSRPYGGNLCSGCCEIRIKKAFLYTEASIGKQLNETKKD